MYHRIVGTLPHVVYMIRRTGVSVSESFRLPFVCSAHPGNSRHLHAENLRGSTAASAAPSFSTRFEVVQPLSKTGTTRQKQNWPAGEANVFPLPPDNDSRQNRSTMDACLYA